MSIKKILVALQFSLFLITTCAISENILPEYIEMNTKEYNEHSKDIVRFNHRKHIEEHSILCGGCHHDQKGKKLKIQEGDHVNKCIVCHKETGKSSKGEKLSKKEKILKYHKEAIHSACKKCHKKINESKENELEKIAPTKCKGCHSKKK